MTIPHAVTHKLRFFIEKMKIAIRDWMHYIFVPTVYVEWCRVGVDSVWKQEKLTAAQPSVYWTLGWAAVMNARCITLTKALLQLDKKSHEILHLAKKPNLKLDHDSCSGCRI